MRQITVYAKEKSYIKEGKTNTFYVYSSSLPSKTNKDETIYFEVKLTKKCTKKLPNQHCEIQFDVSKSYYFSQDVILDNGKAFRKNTLWLDDFDIVGDYKKKITTDDELPF